MRVALQALLNQQGQARESAPHVGMAGRKPHPHIAGYGDHRRSSTSRTRASASGSTCASTRMRRRLPRSISISPFRDAAIDRTRLSSSGRSLAFSACFCRSNLHRRKTCPDLLDRSRLSSPGEHHARRHPVATRNLRHLRPRRQRLLDNPHLVVMRPAPSPLNPVQYLDTHRLMTLKLDLRSHASRNTPRQTRRRSSDAYYSMSAMAQPATKFRSAAK